ncbi:hypothetical protein MMC30_008425 [Trapelia coarctata]|nr:hypothetical protein [Trapelia coarctata]
MHTVLSPESKETVNRNVPKSANKIQAVAVARLYIAYPNKHKWTYTGLQGAAVLANDLIGNTFWIKMVDVSPTNRGVIWDQEIYDTFSYNQDRTFFHTFELENCLAGLSFTDEKEAKTFKKKMDDREKNASKETKATSFQGAGPDSAVSNLVPTKHHGRFGSLLQLGHRSSSASHMPAPPQAPSIIPPRETPTLPSPTPAKNGISMLDEVDPSWRGMLSDLLALGITEDQIEEHADFIKSYIEQRQAEGSTDGALEETSNGVCNDRRGKAPPPPPPPPPPSSAKSISPQNTGSTVSSRRGPAPALPPARRSRVDNHPTPSPAKVPTPTSRSPERTPSPPRPALRFRAPPPIADAGKYAHSSAPAPPSRPRALSAATNAGPPPPPRPPKTPMDDEAESKPRFGVPPPFQGAHVSPNSHLPPPRVPVPPPPPRASRGSHSAHAIPPASAAPPPLPPKTPNGPASSSAPPFPPPLPNHRSVPSAPPLPSTGRPVPQAGPPSVGPPPPPPLPSNSAPPPPPLPPSMSSAGGPPPPPLPPGRGSANALSPPHPPPGKDDLLTSIRASGGAGSGLLKRVSSQEKRDRSAAMVPGAATSNPSAGASQTNSTGGGGGLADALAQALSARNKKVSASDDEEDDDDWDETPKRK